jgi:hypothetical protein
LDRQCDKSELLRIKIVLYGPDNPLSQKLETLYQWTANHYFSFLIFDIYIFNDSPFLSNSDCMILYDQMKSNQPIRYVSAAMRQLKDAENVHRLPGTLNVLLASF